MKVRMTFLGGPDAGNVGENTWGTVGTGQMTFELNKPVEIDTEDPAHAPNRRFLEDMIRKARGNRFYRVEDMGGSHLHAATTNQEAATSQAALKPESRVPQDQGRGPSKR